ncbi:HlyD family type I secretion periplasmic adaptor subunit [Microvirga roseola]|uniref:HlyD family type I secretion periplasmic adaptor subunit n=1 Tax=Microvirga roseola TaxID=2883126 RepID=UPI001E62ED05|nr:HlyD family type I secretion periplasmic adaptor subunit [Microvirga roseola]
MAVISSRALAQQCEGALPSVPSTPFPRLRHVALAGNSLIAIFMVGLGAWAIVAPLRSAAIAAGIVEAETSRKTVQHLEGGIVRTILVRDGDRVHAGQALLRLEDTRARTQLQVLRSQLWDAQAREARLLAERGGLENIDLPDELHTASQSDPAVRAILAGQQAIFESRRQVMRSQNAVLIERSIQVEKEIIGLKAQEAAAGKRSQIIRREIDTVQALVNKGLTPRPRLLALQREMVEIDGRRGETAARISRAYQVIAEVKANLLKLQSDHQNEVVQSLHKTQNLMMQLAEKIQAAADQLSRTEVTAPESGVVTDLRVRTPGGVISPGAPLMDIIPQDDRLIVNARLRPEDIDVVRVGQAAEVHLLAYKQRRVPPLKGSVVYVSADRLVDRRTDQAYFATQIRVDEGHPEHVSNVEMVPGMPVQVFIETGESTAALYALGPLLDSFHRAFRED